MYVLDTNTLIYCFKGTGAVPKKLLANNPKDIAIPTIVLYELEVGIAGSSSPQKRRLQLQELASVV
jgi:tRNA(fMet)-specific endonuclease VapC